MELVSYSVSSLVLRQAWQTGYIQTLRIRQVIVPICVCVYVYKQIPSLWSSGQSSWLQIQRSLVRFVVGLERGQLSLMRITEELFKWKSSGSGSRKSRLMALGVCCADHATPSIR
jgi:hypothetical protein